MISESLIRSFLNTLGTHYYVFGGKALSRILKNVQSSDWDIIIDKKFETIDTVKKKLDRVFGKGVIQCTKKSFTQVRSGKYSVIYGCDPNKGEELFDIKFEDFSTLDLPIIQLNGIRYADLEILYANIQENLREKNDFFREYKKLKKRTSNKFIQKQINHEIREYMEMLNDAEDEEEREEIMEEIRIMKSREHFNKIKTNVLLHFQQLKSDYIFAKRVYNKNKKRLNDLLDALKHPNEFTLDYLDYLCKNCSKNVKVKKIGRRKLSCKKLRSKCKKHFNTNRFSERKT